MTELSSTDTQPQADHADADGPDGTHRNACSAHAGQSAGSTDPAPHPSQPKPDKSHIVGLSLALDSLIPAAEQSQAPKRSHRGSVGQAKKAKWTSRDWCWAGWNWGANEAYQGYYDAQRAGSGQSSQQPSHDAGQGRTVAAAMPGPAMPKPRPYNRAYTMPAAAIDAAAATLGATSKAAMPVSPSAGVPIIPDQGMALSSLPGRVATHELRPVGQSPHWSIPAPLLPGSPASPGLPVRVAQADERLGPDAPPAPEPADGREQRVRSPPQERPLSAAVPDPLVRSLPQDRAPITPMCPTPATSPVAPSLPSPMPQPVPDPPSPPAVPAPAVPSVRGSPVQLLHPTIWDLTHSQVCHYRLQRGAQLERLLRNLTQLLDG